jgi:hypothetical protein
MAALFFAVEGTVYQDHSKFNPRTTPNFSAPNGPAFFSAFEKTKPTQVAEVRTQVNQMFSRLLEQEQKHVVDKETSDTEQRTRDAARERQPNPARVVSDTGGVGTPENGQSGPGPSRRTQ